MPGSSVSTPSTSADRCGLGVKWEIPVLAHAVLDRISPDIANTEADQRGDADESEGHPRFSRLIETEGEQRRPVGGSVRALPARRLVHSRDVVLGIPLPGAVLEDSESIFRRNPGAVPYTRHEVQLLAERQTRHRSRVAAILKKQELIPAGHF